MHVTPNGIAIPQNTLIFIGAVVLIVFLSVWFQIYRKAGYSGFLCLLMIIPGVNILTILWFAFLARWPATRQR